MTQTIDALAAQPAQVPGDRPLINRNLRHGRVAELRKRARRRVPRFAFEFVDHGAGVDANLRRHREALDDLEIISRYGYGAPLASTEITLFGRRYAAPFAVAPMGMGGLIWSGAEEYLAAAAQAARIPYTLATPGASSIERIAAIAPDMFWYQAGSMPRDNYAYTLDLARRAKDAGAHVLLATIDTPASPRRPRNALTFPFRPNIATILSVATSPAWFLQLLRRGVPRFENVVAYAGPNASSGDINRFALTEMRGGMTWDTVKRLRDLWPRAFVVKGIQHPLDVDRAIELGADGVDVSTHGARQIETAPATIDMLPAIVERVAGRMTILMDSGIRSGLDVVRALAVGASAVLIGRPFLYAIGALGEKGGAYIMDLLIEDTRTALAQIGALDCAAASKAIVRHRRAYSYRDFEPDTALPRL